jgi:hypothetical protein
MTMKEVLARYYALPAASPEKMGGFVVYLKSTCRNCYAMRHHHIQDKCLFQSTHFESPTDAVKRMGTYVDTYQTMSGLKNMTLEHSQEFWGSAI